MLPIRRLGRIPQAEARHGRRAKVDDGFECVRENGGRAGDKVGPQLAHEHEDGHGEARTHGHPLNTRVIGASIVRPVVVVEVQEHGAQTTTRIGSFGGET